MSLFDLSGRVLALTGGYGHLGRAIARGLAQHGARVVVVGRNEAAFAAAFEADSNLSIEFETGDVADTASVKAAFQAIHRRHGALHGLINNAFYSKGQQPDALTDAEFAFGLDGSLGSTYRCIREVLPHLRANPTGAAGGTSRGKIINVASMYGLVAPDFAAYADAPQMLNPPHYGAAKAGVVQLTKYFAAWLGPEQIQVNCVSPGAFPSPTVQQNVDFADELRRRIPAGRLGQPNDLAGAFVFLASAAADFVTGHNLVVDGGWTIR